MPKEQLMSLKTFGFQPTVFTPMEYKQEAIHDPRILAESLAASKAWKDKAEANVTGLDKTYIDTKDKLNIAEHDWLRGKFDDIRSEIDSISARGDYESAINYATNAARELARSEELQNKLKTSNMYATRAAEVDKSNIRDISKKYWHAHNPYKYNGTAEWKEKEGLGTEITPTQFVKLVDATTVEKQDSKSEGGTNQYWIDSSGNKTNDVTAAVAALSTTSSESSKSFRSKSPEDLEKTMNILLNDSSVRAGLLKNFQVDNWGYKDAKATLDNPDATEDEKRIARQTMQELAGSIIDENGFIIEDFETYKTKKIIPAVYNQAYRYESVSSRSGTTINRSRSSSGNSGDGVDEEAVNKYTMEADMGGTKGASTVQYHIPYVENWRSLSVMKNNNINYYDYLLNN